MLTADLYMHMLYTKYWLLIKSIFVIQCKSDSLLTCLITTTVYLFDYYCFFLSTAVQLKKNKTKKKTQD